VIATLGVDVGGTKTSVGPVGASGALLARPIVDPTRTEDTGSLIDGLESTLGRAFAEFRGHRPGAIGLACAGTVDGSRGVVVSSPNLPLDDEPLAAVLEDRLGIPVVLENDANAAVLAEAVAGVAAGLRHVVLIALGTGVGGGLYLDGGLYRGAGGAAGEIGHMIVKAGGRACACGAHGCIEMYASGRAFARYAAKRADDPAADPEGTIGRLVRDGSLEGEALAALARSGYAGALEAVEELAGWLGIGLVNLTNTFNPEMIVVGGGVSALGEMLLGPAREYLANNAMIPGRNQVRVETAALGNTAGLVGGGLLAWDRIGAG